MSAFIRWKRAKKAHKLASRPRLYLQQSVIHKRRKFDVGAIWEYKARLES